MHRNSLSSNNLWTKSNLDLPLLVAISILLLYALLILYSASGENLAVVNKQALRIGFGFIVMVLCAKINPAVYYRIAPWCYALGVFSLLAVLLIGYTSKGAQRWLTLGGMRFQPAEMMKIAVPLMIAAYFADKPLPPRPYHVILVSILILVPGLLIAKQPDLGTCILIISSGMFVLFFAGLSLKIILWLGVTVLGSAPILWTILHDYQRQRILTLLNPERDPLGKGYHIIQSKIAIGSGGFLGKGWLEGTQSQLEFLPERTTDFIFAVLSEEFGLVGILFLLSIYLFIIMRGLSISKKSNDNFSRLLSSSLILTFFIYVFVNIGMVTGILPVVGLPLPLVSYGGTSMLTIMASFGIIMSVKAHKKML